MPQTKGIGRTVQKYQARVAVATGDYKAGIAAPRVPWSQGASAGNSAWKEGVQAAVSRDAFSTGVSKAGDSKWKSASDQLGSQRYSPGVTFGLPYYQSGMGPVLSTIEATSLAQRGAAGSSQNYARSQAIGDALHAAKLASK